MQRLRTKVLQAFGRTGLPGRHRIISHLAPCPPAGTRSPFECELHGTAYQGNLSEYIDWHIFYFGSYASGELQFLEKCSIFLEKKRNSLSFFDIGANIGEFSTFMSKRVATVHAFEPNMDLVERLEAHVSRNSLHNVILHPVALGDHHHRSELGSGFPGNPGSRSLTWSFPDAKVDLVEVVQGDDHFMSKRLPRLDIVKIDVEGYEKNVICGLASRLREDRPIILMEMIGQTTKGGFASEDDLRRNLYPDHQLRSLTFRGSLPRLGPFDWNCEAAVVVPAEYSDLS